MAYVFGSITSIPPAVNALFSIFSAAYPVDANGEAVTFWFGTALPAWEAATIVQISAIDGNQDPATLGPNFLREETFSVKCDITVFAGMPPTPVNYLANMGAVWNVWKALETAVANNPELNGTVRYAEFGAMVYQPAQDAKGMVMGTLTWDVRCSARVTSLS